MTSLEFEATVTMVYLRRYYNVFLFKLWTVEFANLMYISCRVFQNGKHSDWQTEYDWQAFFLRINGSICLPSNLIESGDAVAGGAWTLLCNACSLSPRKGGSQNAQGRSHQAGYSTQQLYAV